MAADKVTDVGGQAVDHSLGSLPRAGAEGSDHPFRAEFISVGIERFSDAIGVKQQAIIAFEGHGKVAGYPIEHVSAVNSEGHPRRLQHFDFAARGAIKSGASCPPRESVTWLFL